MANNTLAHQTFFANRYADTEAGMRDLPAGEYYIELIDEVVDTKTLEEQLSTIGDTTVVRVPFEVFKCMKPLYSLYNDMYDIHRAHKHLNLNSEQEIPLRVYGHLKQEYLYEYSLALMTDIDGFMDITRFTIPRPANDDQEAAMEKVAGKHRYMRLGAIVDNRETIDFYFTNDPAGI